jgi:hypothetical protein
MWFVTNPLVRETNIPPAPTGIYGRLATMVYFAAITFFPCHGRLPLSAVCLYLGDTLAVLCHCHAGDLCASLVSPKGPSDARVWVFSSLFLPSEATFRKQPGPSYSHIILFNSRRSGYTVVLHWQSSSREEVVSFLSYTRPTLWAPPRRLNAVSIAVLT